MGDGPFLDNRVGTFSRKEAELALERDQVPLGIVGSSGVVIVEDRKDEGLEGAAELGFGEDLTEEFGDVVGGVAKGAAAEGAEDDRVVVVVGADAQDGAHLRAGGLDEVRC